MTIGEKLLALTLEYRYAVENPATLDSYGLAYEGRTTEEIGADFEREIRGLLGA